MVAGGQAISLRALMQSSRSTSVGVGNTYRKTSVPETRWRFLENVAA